MSSPAGRRAGLRRAAVVPVQAAPEGDTISGSNNSFIVVQAELLNPSASDLAVRMALGETQVMAATKRDLAAAGVDVARLEASAGAGADKAAVPRSADTLLVKNLPYATTAAELEASCLLPLSCCHAARRARSKVCACPVSAATVRGVMAASRARFSCCFHNTWFRWQPGESTLLQMPLCIAVRPT